MTRPRPTIPPLRFWPRGFKTDFATGVPDRPILWIGPRPGTRLKPWRWFTRISIREAAWWHDAGYYLGYPPPRADLAALADCFPVSNRLRTAEWLARIDADLKADFIASGMHPVTAHVAVDVVIERLGARHYWWATEQEWEKRGFGR